VSATRLRLASPADLERVLEMVRAYHAFEGMAVDDDTRRAGLEWLLGRSEAGRVWLIEHDGEVCGYAALAFGSAIEHGGRDAFLDELFVLEERRGQGIGRAALAALCAEARALGVRALNLEVARANHRAKGLYASLGFESREQYHLMSLRLLE